MSQQIQRNIDSKLKQLPNYVKRGDVARLKQYEKDVLKYLVQLKTKGMDDYDDYEKSVTDTFVKAFNDSKGIFVVNVIKKLDQNKKMLIQCMQRPNSAQQVARYKKQIEDEMKKQDEFLSSNDTGKAYVKEMINFLGNLDKEMEKIKALQAIKNITTPVDKQLNFLKNAMEKRPQDLPKYFKSVNELITKARPELTKTKIGVEYFNDVCKLLQKAKDVGNEFHLKATADKTVQLLTKTVQKIETYMKRGDTKTAKQQFDLLVGQAKVLVDDKKYHKFPNVAAFLQNYERIRAHFGTAIQNQSNMQQMQVEGECIKKLALQLKSALERKDVATCDRSVGELNKIYPRFVAQFKQLKAAQGYIVSTKNYLDKYNVEIAAMRADSQASQMKNDVEQDLGRLKRVLNSKQVNLSALSPLMTSINARIPALQKLVVSAIAQNLLKSAKVIVDQVNAKHGKDLAVHDVEVIIKEHQGDVIHLNNYIAKKDIVMVDAFAKHVSRGMKRLSVLANTSNKSKQFFGQMKSALQSAGALNARVWEQQVKDIETEMEFIIKSMKATSAQNDPQGLILRRKLAELLNLLQLPKYVNMKHSKEVVANGRKYLLEFNGTKVSLDAAKTEIQALTAICMYYIKSLPTCKDVNKQFSIITLLLRAVHPLRVKTNRVLPSAKLDYGSKVVNAVLNMMKKVQGAFQKMLNMDEMKQVYQKVSTQFQQVQKCVDIETKRKMIKNLMLQLQPLRNHYILHPNIQALLIQIDGYYYSMFGTLHSQIFANGVCMTITKDVPVLAKANQIFQNISGYLVALEYLSSTEYGTVEKMNKTLYSHVVASKIELTMKGLKKMMVDSQTLPQELQKDDSPNKVHNSELIKTLCPLISQYIALMTPVFVNRTKESKKGEEIRNAVTASQEVYDKQARLKNTYKKEEVYERALRPIQEITKDEMEVKDMFTKDSSSLATANVMKLARQLERDLNVAIVRYNSQKFYETLLLDRDDEFAKCQDHIDHLLKMFGKDSGCSDVLDIVYKKEIALRKENEAERLRLKKEREEKEEKQRLADTAEMKKLYIDPFQDCTIEVKDVEGNTQKVEYKDGKLVYKDFKFHVTPTAEGVMIDSGMWYYGDLKGDRITFNSVQGAKFKHTWLDYEWNRENGTLLDKSLLHGSDPHKNSYKVDNSGIVLEDQNDVKSDAMDKSGVRVRSLGAAGKAAVPLLLWAAALPTFVEGLPKWYEKRQKFSDLYKVERERRRKISENKPRSCKKCTKGDKLETCHQCAVTLCRREFCQKGHNCACGGMEKYSFVSQRWEAKTRKELGFLYNDSQL